MRHLTLFAFLLTIFLTIAHHEATAGGVLSKLQAAASSLPSSRCGKTSVTFVVDTASFINNNKLVPTRQLMHNLGLAFFDTQGAVFAMVDASRLAVGDVVVSSANLLHQQDGDIVSNNASVRYFSTGDENEPNDNDKDDLWLNAVDDFWLHASLSLNLAKMPRLPLSYEAIESIVESTSKRLVRKHRTQLTTEDETATTTTTITTSEQGDSNSTTPKDDGQKISRTSVVLIIVSYIPKQLRNLQQTDDDWESRLITNDDEQKVIKPDEDLLLRQQQQQPPSDVRKLVLCIDCPASECNNPASFRILRNLAGGSRLDVFCLPPHSSNLHQHQTLIVTNLMRSACDSANECRFILEHNIERQHGQVPTTALPFEFTGSLFEPVNFPSCTYYLKCTLRPGYGSDQLFEELAQCKEGQFYSTVTSSCLSHSEKTAPCQPNFCTSGNTGDLHRGNIARRMAASAAVEAASALAEKAKSHGFANLDVSKLLMLMHVNQTIQQSCISLASETGNCRVFATCHPDTSQTLLHCCPPGRKLLAGTCSCVKPEVESDCPLSVSCSPNEGNDMTWAEMFEMSDPYRNNDGTNIGNNYNHPPWVLSSPPKAHRASVRLRSSFSVMPLSSQEVVSMNPLARRRHNVQLRNRGMAMMAPKQKRGILESIEQEPATTTITTTVPTTTLVNILSQDAEPIIGEYCIYPVTTQRRRGPTPKSDAANVFYVYDWINNEWLPHECEGDQIFDVKSCTCASS